MIYATLCSGIGAPELAFSGFGWQQAFCAEIEPFPCAVLEQRFPGVPNLGDITKFKSWPDYAIDLLVGGTPCQSFSVAGLRAGINDPRGNLALVFLAIIDRYKPRWVLWENVPGVHSSWSDAATHPPSRESLEAGEAARRYAIAAGFDADAAGSFGEFVEVDQSNDFDCFLSGLEKLGYGVGTTILDAQYAGLAQRRERVFVVGHSGGQWQRAAAVLSLGQSVCWNPPARSQKREGIAPTISARTKGGGGLGTDFDCDGGLIDVAHSLRADGFDASEDGTGRGTPIVPEISSAIKSLDYKGPSSDGDGDGAPLIAFSCKDHGADAGEISPTLRACGHNESHAKSGAPPAIAFQPRIARNGRGDMGDKVNALNAQSGQTGKGDAAPCVAFKPSYFSRGNKTSGAPETEKCHSLTSSPKAGDTAATIQQGYAVRRLTPRECERLQGFPDDFTAIEYHGKPACDGPRYKALGNSMAVPVIRWIGQQIRDLEKYLCDQTSSPTK